jgi:hypothetical protein
VVEVAVLEGRTCTSARRGGRDGRRRRCQLSNDWHDGVFGVGDAAAKQATQHGSTEEGYTTS